ncbi:hypothetical protein BDV26DRAFT_145246 [Aspergillus bertholletiae]|uniref:Uncharacterized protein n=1 Tax=Aspergillus bertholletiae TaxID=1226010 RepID=A0A5N7BEJ5_9EURO|nr:hypothetical protein BDV26DRAFT_145246 [Aspergillus bertholletiae]
MFLPSDTVLATPSPVVIMGGIDIYFIVEFALELNCCCNYVSQWTHMPVDQCLAATVSYIQSRSYRERARYQFISIKKKGPVRMKCSRT